MHGFDEVIHGFWNTKNHINFFFFVLLYFPSKEYYGIFSGLAGHSLSEN